MPRRTALAALLVSLAFVGAGCLDGEQTTATPNTVVGTVPTETNGGNLPADNLKGDAAAGKKVYTSQPCGSCHTLKDAGSSGTVGPNLDEAKPSFDLVVERVTNGKSPMPAFKGQLTDQQIADVAEYVSSVAGS